MNRFGEGLIQIDAGFNPLSALTPRCLNPKESGTGDAGVSRVTENLQNM